MLQSLMTVDHCSSGGNSEFIHVLISTPVHGSASGVEA